MMLSSQNTGLPFFVVQTADAALNGGRLEVVFISGRVSDAAALAEQARPGVAVVILDAAADGLAAMAAWARSNDGFDAIHLISHGAAGHLELGTLVLDLDGLAQRQADLAVLRAALDEDGDLLLYGCDVASGEGAAFVAELAVQTGADVAASTDLTGSVELGGNWVLEAQLGAIETAAFDGPAVKWQTNI
ncbi:DUF4347 domain-containing protein [Rhizobium sp. LjRoot30]|uniref:DUF4347 domain-containing protein n=1 Tax=Rhizobium sp. LjRoot30 TaxID=3342320 RepID=UPI003ECE54B2